MVITELKFETAPKWGPEQLKKLVYQGKNVFVDKNKDRCTTYSFSKDWKECEIMNVNYSRGNRAPFLFTVNVDFITLEDE